MQCRHRKSNSTKQRHKVKQSVTVLAKFEARRHTEVNKEAYDCQAERGGAEYKLVCKQSVKIHGLGRKKELKVLLQKRRGCNMSSGEIVNVTCRVSNSPVGEGWGEGVLTPTFNNTPQPRQFQMKILSRSARGCFVLWDTRNTGTPPAPLSNPSNYSNFGFFRGSRRRPSLCV